MKILVIDDDECDQLLLSRWLDAHEVDVVDSIAAAAMQASRVRYDIVICDVTMPEINGLRPVDIIEFCKRIQGAQLVAVSNVGNADAAKSQSDVCQIVDRRQNKDPQALVIELLNDVEEMQRKMRAS